MARTSSIISKVDSFTITSPCSIKHLKCNRDEQQLNTKKKSHLNKHQRKRSQLAAMITVSTSNALSIITKSIKRTTIWCSLKIELWLDRDFNSIVHLICINDTHHLSALIYDLYFMEAESHLHSTFILLLINTIN